MNHFGEHCGHSSWLVDCKKETISTLYWAFSISEMATEGLLTYIHQNVDYNLNIHTKQILGYKCQ